MAAPPSPSPWLSTSRQKRGAWCGSRLSNYRFVVGASAPSSRLGALKHPLRTAEPTKKARRSAWSPRFLHLVWRGLDGSLRLNLGLDACQRADKTPIAALAHDLPIAEDNLAVDDGGRHL